MRFRKTILFRGAVAAVASAFFCVAACAQQPVSVKVMSMNVKEGGQYAGYSTEAFAECIAQYDPDIVVFQEMDRFTNRAARKDLTAEIGARLGMFPFYGKAMDYSGGAFGNAILSKYPFYTARNIVSRPEGASENRTCTWIDLLLPDEGRLRVAVTHLDVSSEQVRISTLATINANIITDEFPVLLIGDFNASPDSDTMQYARNRWQDIGSGTAYTYPSTGPTARIDYVMGYPKAWSYTSYEVVAHPDLSDHCFIVAQVEYR